MTDGKLFIFRRKQETEDSDVDDMSVSFVQYLFSKEDD